MSWLVVLVSLVKLVKNGNFNCQMIWYETRTRITDTKHNVKCQMTNNQSFRTLSRGVPLFMSEIQIPRNSEKEL